MISFPIVLQTIHKFPILFYSYITCHKKNVERKKQINLPTLKFYLRLILPFPTDQTEIS